jgi:hypothetical protein
MCCANRMMRCNVKYFLTRLKSFAIGVVFLGGLCWWILVLYVLFLTTFGDVP